MNTDYHFTNEWFNNGLSIWNNVIQTEISKLKKISILEIGCYEGQATIWFLQAFPHASVTVIDTFEGNIEHHLRGWNMSKLEQTFIDNIRLTGRADAVTILRGRSQEKLQLLAPESFDLIYVDGDHREKNVWIDLQHSDRLLRKGGILVCDDYGWEPPEFKDRPDMTPKPAIDRFLKTKGYNYKLLYSGWQVVIAKTK